MQFNIKIIGRGKELPSRKVPSQELEKLFSLKAGTIEAKFGVKNRYWAREESNASLGARALQNALNDANLQFEDIDLLLNTSATFDFPLPSTASFIQRELGKSDSGIPSYDINSSCLSFLSGLHVAASFIHLGIYNRIAIVTSEISSKSLDIDNIETYSLFGDGAVAFILGKSKGNSYCQDFKFNTYSEGAFYTAVKGGGNVMHHHNPDAINHEKDFYFQMEGSKVLKFTIGKLHEFLEEYIEETGMEINDYRHIIPHQASKLALKYLKKHYNLNAEQLHLSLSKYGNTIAASIPITLYDAIEDDKIKRGDDILLLGTAAGITIGAASLKY